MNIFCALAFFMNFALCQQPETADGLIRAMHARYSESWYRTLTFTQKTVAHHADGSTKKEIWYEAMNVPGSLRIDFAPQDSGNGVLFTSDSLFVFQRGSLRSSRPFVHSLLVLAFDVYLQNVDETLRKLSVLHYDLTKFHEDVWQKRPVYVVGASKGDQKSRQFWIDKERLLFVRSLEPNPRDPSVTTEIQFNKYEKFGGGWVAPEVLFMQNGKVVTEEYYTEIKVDVKLQDNLFSTTKWK